MSENHTLATERGLEREHGVERVNYTLKEDGLPGGEAGKAKRAFLGEGESMSG